jgi:hypothetical protein
LEASSIDAQSHLDELPVKSCQLNRSMQHLSNQLIHKMLTLKNRPWFDSVLVIEARGDSTSGSTYPVTAWPLMAGIASALILLFCWTELLLAVFEIPKFVSRPIGLNVFLISFAIALALSLYAGRRGSRYWYVASFLVCLTICVIIFALH